MKVILPDPPEDRPQLVIGKFSGGRSSALACRAALDAGVVEEIVFNNPGLESPQTYEFLEAIGEQWFGGKLTLLESRGEKGEVRVVPSVAELAKKGEPMTEMIKRRLILPSPLSRVCTTELKIKTTFRHLYKRIDYKTTKVVSVIGFRYEEQGRIASMRSRNEAMEAREREGLPYLKWTDAQTAPLADAKMDRQAVLKAFKGTVKGLSFDPSDESVRLSNCLGCFFSNREELLRVARHDPWYADYWDNLERSHYEWRGDQLAERPAKIKAIIKAGEEPQDDYERNAYSIAALPWSVLKRVSAKRKVIPIQSSIFEPGGCGDGDCGVDI